MPWSNQGGGGPWGTPGGGQNPWNRGNNGGGPTPPDLEAMLRRGQDRVRRALPKGFGGGRGLLIILALILLAALYLLAAMASLFPRTPRPVPNSA